MPSAGDIPRRQAIAALVVATLAFTVCFAAWVINAVLVTFLSRTGAYAFDQTQIGWLIAVPILTGTISRVPLGLLTDRFGGRATMTALLLVVAAMLYLLSLVHGYAAWLLVSLGFGLAGGLFPIGVGYVSLWFEPKRQGTALGTFAAGATGAALTTIFAPRLLSWATAGGTHVEGWRLLPRVYAGIVLAVAVVALLLAPARRAAGGQTLRARLAPLRDIVVWRLGLYYFFLFGGFVALAQWLIPYCVTAYRLSVAEAGLLAATFSLPAGLFRLAGGVLSDRLGPQKLMYWVFSISAVVCVVLSIPRMDVHSPGAGILAARAGRVGAVSPGSVAVGDRQYRLRPPPERSLTERDGGEMLLPRIASWHVPVVTPDETVEKGQLLARGVTNFYYPANVWLFAALLALFGMVAGAGNAGVYKFMLAQFPTAAGAVSGIVGMMGALGGFVLPPVFGALLGVTGLWSSCWMLLAILALVCLVSMHVVVRRIMREEAPDLVRLLERRPAPPAAAAPAAPGPARNRPIAGLLRRIPFFKDLERVDLERLQAIGRHRSVDGDQVIFREGDPGDAFYLLIEGAVRIHRGGAAGQTLATVEDNGFFGELALIDGEPRSASATTVKPCELFVIGRHDFLVHLSRSPQLLAEVLVGHARKIRRNTQQIAAMAEEHERVRSEAEIERHRSIAHMVAGVAHEINTPLGIVNQAASIISEHIDADKARGLARDEAAAATLGDVADAARLIQTHIGRADTLIQSFKSLSARHISGRKETTDLRALLGDSVGLYRLKERKSKLDVQIVDNGDAAANGTATWTGYPGHFTQVMVNLLSNIDRYAYPGGAGGKVEIRVGRRAEGFDIDVRDFGRGIDEEHLAKVFEPFVTTGRAIGGTGLGLAIVRNLVTTSLGGTVRIDSRPGEGTCVSLFVPPGVKDDRREEAP